jgi:hypothetical protein
MRRKTLAAVAVLTLAAGLLALTLLAGGAAGGNGHGKGRGHGSTASGQTGYHFVVADIGAGNDRMILQGDGSFNGNQAHGGGSFDHFLANSGTPAPVVASGTWKADDVVHFTSGTSHGTVFQGGELVMHATFYPIGHAPIANVTVDVVCNLGPAGFSIPGKSEGVYVTFPGSLSFAPSGTGVTIFTTANH